ncbi:MAG: CoB--CoM heterodisulfide reductase iron-sulfur subunit B family protein [Deltaproteobacteria bacterium]|nr:CoB--CoM heterodisulfide reductase iron-sulfur subunit B family protein [Deltaproteobacteria bacterium]
MRVGYYPGCSLTGTSREFDESVRSVARALEIDLAEVPEWNCCGSSPAHMIDTTMSIALPANVLLKAKRAGLAEVLTPCAACYSRLLMGKHEIETKPATRAQVERVLGCPPGSLDELPKVLNVIEFLAQIPETIAAKVTSKFEHTVACYYGCLLVRPPKVTRFDRTEDPVEMDKLVALVGGKTIDWSFKTECCGASFSISRTSVVGRLSSKIMQDATRRHAEAIVVSCPMCHSNLDLRRREINRRMEKPTLIPVLFITQVIGLALGLSEKRLGLKRHFVPVKLPAKTLPAQVVS